MYFVTRTTGRNARPDPAPILRAQPAPSERSCPAKREPTPGTAATWIRDQLKDNKYSSSHGSTNRVDRCPLARGASRRMGDDDLTTSLPSPRGVQRCGGQRPGRGNLVEASSDRTPRSTRSGVDDRGTCSCWPMPSRTVIVDGRSGTRCMHEWTGGKRANYATRGSRYPASPFLRVRRAPEL